MLATSKNSSAEPQQYYRQYVYYFSDLTRLSQTSLDDRRVKLDIIVLVKSDLSPKTGQVSPPEFLLEKVL